MMEFHLHTELTTTRFVQSYEEIVCVVTIIYVLDCTKCRHYFHVFEN